MNLRLETGFIAGDRLIKRLYHPWYMKKTLALLLVASLLLAGCTELISSDEDDEVKKIEVNEDIAIEKINDFITVDEDESFGITMMYDMDPAMMGMSDMLEVEEDSEAIITIEMSQAWSPDGYYTSETSGISNGDSSMKFVSTMTHIGTTMYFEIGYEITGNICAEEDDAVKQINSTMEEKYGEDWQELATEDELEEAFEAYSEAESCEWTEQMMEAQPVSSYSMTTTTTHTQVIAAMAEETAGNSDDMDPMEMLMFLSFVECMGTFTPAESVDGLQVYDVSMEGMDEDSMTPELALCMFDTDDSNGVSFEEIQNADDSGDEEGDEDLEGMQSAFDEADSDGDGELAGDELDTFIGMMNDDDGMDDEDDGMGDDSDSEMMPNMAVAFNDQGEIEYFEMDMQGTMMKMYVLTEDRVNSFFTDVDAGELVALPFTVSDSMDGGSDDWDDDDWGDDDDYIYYCSNDGESYAEAMGGILCPEGPDVTPECPNGELCVCIDVDGTCFDGDDDWGYYAEDMDDDHDDHDHGDHGDDHDDHDHGDHGDDHDDHDHGDHGDDHDDHDHGDHGDDHDDHHDEEFTCDDGETIPMYWVNDGEEDCVGGEDEGYVWTYNYDNCADSDDGLSSLDCWTNEMDVDGDGTPEDSDSYWNYECEQLADGTWECMTDQINYYDNCAYEGEDYYECWLNEWDTDDDGSYDLGSDGYMDSECEQLADGRWACSHSDGDGGDGMLTPELVLELFDTDGDSMLSWDEFWDSFESESADDEDALSLIFDENDDDMDGLLSEEELEDFILAVEAYEDGDEPTFICGNGEEIPFRYVNDRVADCADGADEQQYDSDGNEINWFDCMDGTQIWIYEVNDGYEDCQDGEDEMPDMDDDHDGHDHDDHGDEDQSDDHDDHAHGDHGDDDGDHDDHDHGDHGDDSDEIVMYITSGMDFDFEGDMSDYKIELATCDEDYDWDTGESTKTCTTVMAVAIADAGADSDIVFHDADSSGTISDGDMIHIYETAEEWDTVRLYSISADAYSDENPMLTVPGFTGFVGMLALLGAAFIRRNE